MLDAPRKDEFLRRHVAAVPVTHEPDKGRVPKTECFLDKFGPIVHAAVAIRRRVRVDVPRRRRIDPLSDFGLAPTFLLQLCELARQILLGPGYGSCEER